MIIRIKSNGSAEIAVPGDAFEPNRESKLRLGVWLLRDALRGLGVPRIVLIFEPHDPDDTK